VATSKTWDRKTGTLLAKARRGRGLAKAHLRRIDKSYEPETVARRYEAERAPVVARIAALDKQIKTYEALVASGINEINGVEVGRIYTERSGNVPPKSGAEEASCVPTRRDPLPWRCSGSSQRTDVVRGSFRHHYTPRGCL
jgi:hypothetical protein